ncbi:hypothetical protein BASA81_001941 [Batrachochytrium salamandrivorans]|nr:hypothetical protein BASA81_001941 [Batrachochytrium salamandrivorans]
MDQAFDDILASIAKANRERDGMRRELDRSNTLKYQLLEVGAETFHLAKQTVMKWIALSLPSAAMGGRFLPVVLLAKVAFSALNRHRPAVVEATPSPNNPELSELLLELSKLREEMSALARTSKEPPPAPSPRPSPIKPPVQRQQPQQPQQRPLPFNADMLVKQRRCAKPVLPNKPPSSSPPIASPDSIQGMLQRAIQEKFKNAPGSHRRLYRGGNQENDSANNSSSSSSSEEEEDENGSFLLEKRAMEDECERATRRPPMPNRTFKTKSYSSSSRLGKSPVKSNINL